MKKIKYICLMSLLLLLFACHSNVSQKDADGLKAMYTENGYTVIAETYREKDYFQAKLSASLQNGTITSKEIDELTALYKKSVVEILAEKETEQIHIYLFESNSLSQKFAAVLEKSQLYPTNLQVYVNQNVVYFGTAEAMTLCDTYIRTKK
ncbi:MAG: hypothetical protein NC182_02185 [Prevotella sp.]|nr:hypothetical protein [Staphylococcus sp.]MCM1349992.1 hypothetical protein [Prevotella sp.]